ncbi:uncharacterized protein LOC110465545 [Mizuhopecten yessoensis]|uniref:uncharacterized protein LOC110465545 n=1 Tax=Mizuhopecten yessoensis TaxID=6573 RepID=UPI000B45CA9B|nr:uncharacterized protein LOC110465545 [Mizuhopecten yessoensis]
MTSHIRIAVLSIIGLTLIFQGKGLVSAQHGASTAPTTAEMEFEAEEMTTTTAMPSTSSTTTKAPAIAHKRPAVIGEQCPTYRYTVSEDKVEFHTMPGQCKIVVQFPPARQGSGFGYAGKRGPPRVQYMAKLP